MNLFGCRHKQTTFPQTPRGGGDAHVVCLSCGAELAYDLVSMKRGARLTVSPTHSTPLHLDWRNPKGISDNVRIKIKEARIVSVTMYPGDPKPNQVLVVAGLLTPPLAEKLKVRECYTEQGVPRRWESFPSPAVRIEGADISLGAFDCRSVLIHKVKIVQPRRKDDTNDTTLEITMRMHFANDVPLTVWVDEQNKDTFDLQINARQEDMGFEDQESEVSGEAQDSETAEIEDPEQEPISAHLTGDALEQHAELTAGPALAPASLVGGTHQRGTKQQRGRRGGERDATAEGIADGTAVIQ